MAHKQQDWKDALQAAKPKRSGFDDDFNQRKQKKEARLMYSKRTLDKDIKNLLNNKIIKYTEIGKIHRKHGIYIT
jgi:hypothetical protein